MNKIAQNFLAQKNYFEMKTWKKDLNSHIEIQEKVQPSESVARTSQQSLLIHQKCMGNRVSFFSAQANVFNDEKSRFCASAHASIVEYSAWKSKRQRRIQCSVGCAVAAIYSYVFLRLFSHKFRTRRSASFLLYSANIDRLHCRCRLRSSAHQTFLYAFVDVPILLSLCELLWLPHSYSTEREHNQN